MMNRIRKGEPRSPAGGHRSPLQIAAILLTLFLLASCASTVPEPAGLVAAIYMAVDLDSDRSGPAVESRAVAVASWTPGAVMDALLSAEPGGGLLPPFPPGTAMLSYDMTDDILTLNLTAPYGRLTGTALTVADICAALTLSQLPGIGSVRLLVEGGAHPAREDRAISQGNVLLDVPALRSLEQAIVVYAADTAGHLIREERMVFIRENEPLERHVVFELLRPSDAPGLTSPFPPETVLIGATTEHGICHVNFTSASIGDLPEREAGIALEALRRTLIASLEGVHAVQFLLDGEPVAWFGGRDTSEPLR
jgi:spore germination protein GerM